MLNTRDTLYSPQDVARILNVAYMTVYRWIQSGELKAYQIQKQYRINPTDLTIFVEKGTGRKLENISSSLSRFIGSGMMDYAYMESRHFPIDLSLGVNPLGCSPLVTDYYKNKNILFTNYSEVVSTSLRRKIGNRYGFKQNEILLGAGVSDLLHLCYVSYINPGEDIVIPETTFPSFEFLAILSHGNPKFVPLAQDFDLDYHELHEAITPSCKLVVLCNPNNPTGRQIDLKKTISIIKKHPKVIFLIDEANIDFGGISFINYVKKYPNLLVFRSFSKGFGLAGLRIGFVAGNKDLVYALQRRQTPFSVNVFAQKFAEASLDDMEFLKKTGDYARKERKYLEVELTKLGYKFTVSDSNYLMVDISGKFKSSKDFISTLNKHNANAVNGDDFRGLNGKYIRLSPRLHETNKKFIEILSAVSVN